MLTDTVILVEHPVFIGLVNSGKFRAINDLSLSTFLALM